MKIIPRRRRREGKTSYLKRKKLLSSKNLRIVFRKTNKYILLQLVDSKLAQDSVKASITSKELLKNGWPEEKSGSLKSLGAAYLTGLLFSKAVGDEKVILDTGLITSTKGSKVYAALKGLVDGGVKIAYNERVFPDEEKIKTIDKFDEVKAKIAK